MQNIIYSGIYRGVVEDIKDPLNLGRCRIRVPSIHGNLEPSQISLLPWARYVSPLPTGMDKGMYILPEVNDILWVFFEGGDKNYPVYLGSTYGIVDGKNEVPLESNEDPETTEVLYKSKDLNGIKACIKKTNEAFLFELGDSSISININGEISIHSRNKLTISSDKDIDLIGNKVNIINKEDEEVI